MRGATQPALKMSFEREFQLPRPMRGATKPLHAVFSFFKISTPTPHAGRDVRGNIDYYGVQYISTPTPHAGRDTAQITIIADWVISTPTPHAGRDLMKMLFQSFLIISTPTPHAGRDRGEEVINRPR